MEESDIEELAKDVGEVKAVVKVTDGEGGRFQNGVCTVTFARMSEALKCVEKVIKLPGL